MYSSANCCAMTGALLTLKSFVNSSSGEGHDTLRWLGPLYAASTLDWHVGLDLRAVSRSAVLELISFSALGTCVECIQAIVSSRHGARVFTAWAERSCFP